MSNITINSLNELDIVLKDKKNKLFFIEKEYIKASNDDFKQQYIRIIKPGANIQVAYKIPEGDKERLQTYEGIVISTQNRGLSKTFKIRRISHGVGVEQTFLLNSPKIISITLKQFSKVRRAKLFYLRGLEGKSARLKRKN